MNITDKIKTMNKKTLYGVSIATVVAVGAAGYLLLDGGNGHATATKQEASVAVPVLTVRNETIESVVTAAGALTSRNTSVLSSKVMGRVTSLAVQEGDQVRAGKLLLTIDSGEITAQAVQAQAAYNNAKLQYDRIKSLYDAKASTQMEMDQATLGLETAQAGLTAAKAMESYTRITAPINGQVMEKKINLGEMALPGQPVLKIEDNEHLRLEVTVREQDILQIRPGQQVKVQIDAMPGKDITGRVGQVVPAADIRTHSFVVKVDVPAEAGLITGMYGKAFFGTGKRDAILVPKEAVIALSGITGVYLVGDGERAFFQMVQTGEEQGGSIEVLAGLKPGDRVVADQRSGRIDGRTLVLAEK
jgi:RND family efflux transporter MFP subunit